MSGSEPNPQAGALRGRERLFFWVCAALGLLHAASFLFVALSRVAYPYDLEWMEGGQLIHSFEMLAGRFPFGKPTADHIAFPYQPFYSALVAGLGALFGLSLPLARAVSILSTLGCAAGVGYAVQRETQKQRLGLLAGLSVFSFYGVTGFWYDLARVDSLFLALLVAGLCVARYVRAPLVSAIASALVLVLAYKTKQLALPFFALVPPLLYPKSRGAAVAFVLLSAALLGVDFWLSQRASGGWFGFFMNDVPRGQPYQPWELVRIAVVLATDVPLLLVLALVGSERLLRSASLSAKLQDTWTLATVLGFAVTVAAWARPGGWSNNLLTTYVFAIVPAFNGINRILEAGSARERGFVFPLLALQLAWLLYDPRPQIPTRDDYAAGERIIELLRAAPGAVFVPDRPWFAVLAGKAPSCHSNAYWELGFQKRPDARVEDLDRRLSERYYALVLVRGVPRRVPGVPPMWPAELIDHYRCDRTLDLPGRGLAPFTGIIASGPRTVCVFDPGKSSAPDRVEAQSQPSRLGPSAASSNQREREGALKTIQPSPKLVGASGAGVH